ncbi:MAG: hypothetical protein PHY12_00470 [Eubacteriales bacterium]|nr:hypothetical protein [Eubacteriales bacterium]
MKKLLAMVLSIALVLTAVSFAAAETAASTKPIKIGMEIYDPTDQEFLALKDYFDNYLSPAMNITFVYSEALSDADGEAAFIDNCAAAGCDAIMGYYNVAGAEAAWRAIENGMYYTYGDKQMWEELKAEPLYLGALTYGENGDFEAGYAMGKYLADAGCKKIVYSNGAADFGVEMFINRGAGFAAGAGDAEIITVSGFPGNDAFSSQQNSALTTQGVDAVATSFNALSGWAQPVAAAGINVPLATIGVVSEDFVNALNGGQISLLVAANIQRYGLQIATIYQAINGTKIVDENGFAPMYNQGYLVIDNGADCAAYAELMNGERVYTAEELMGCTSYERLTELAASFSLEDVTARHAK